MGQGLLFAFCWGFCVLRTRIAHSVNQSWYCFLFALDKHSSISTTRQVTFQGALGEWLAGAPSDW